jgi:DJ-1/PfpI family
MMRNLCFSNLVHIANYRSVSIGTARKLLSTYCIAVLSVPTVDRIYCRQFHPPSRIYYPYNTVNSFIPTLSLQPFRSCTNTHKGIPTPISFKMSSTTSEDNQPKQILVPIADGSEEIETACITDTLTRFGARVTVASVKSDQSLVCTMSRGLKIMADCTIDDAATSEWDMIVLPGGMPGAEHLRDCTTLQTMLQIHAIQKQKPYAAICAAPAVALASSCMNDPTLSSLLSQINTSTTISCEITKNGCYRFRGRCSREW